MSRLIKCGESDQHDIRWIVAELNMLHDSSVRQHGLDYVESSPTYRDCYSKRRIRLVKTYHAIMKGAYAK